VESALAAVAQGPVPVEAIQSVHIGMPEKAMRVVDNREMHNICVQDMVCAALVRGALDLRELPFPGILSDPAYVRLRGVTQVGVDPGLNRDQPEGRGANVTVTTITGQHHAHRVDAPRGHSSRGGASWQDLHDKWRAGLPGCPVDAMTGLTQRLEHLEDTRVLADAFMDPDGDRGT
jgi:2-methylcitrate dehydratase PrpD